MSDATQARPYAVIIEDDPDNARLLSVILRQSGFEPIVAADGPAGLEAVRTHQPTVTTVDVGLPGLDGWSVTRQIREFSSTYIVMISGSAGEEDVLGGFAAGADDYVIKPFRAGELRSRLRAGLRRPADRLSVVMAPPPPASAWSESIGAAQFDGEWVRFRGLRLNLDQGVLTVGASPVSVGRLELELLDLMLRAGTETRTTGELAQSLREEPVADAGPVHRSDRDVVASAMGSLLGILGEDNERPLWIESDSQDGYRLAVQRTS